MLNEWRQQLELPFDGEGKPAHANVLDGLLEIQTKTKVSSYHSDENFDRLFQKAEDNAFEIFQNSFENETLEEIIVQDFMKVYDIDNELYTDIFIKDMTEKSKNNYGEDVDELMDISDIIDKFVDEYSYDIRMCLNAKGIKTFTEYEEGILKDHFKVEISDFQYTVEQDEDGLIDIWRVVNYIKKQPNVDDVWDKDNYNQDEYQEIISHGRLGIYWSWDEDSAEPHWSSGDGINLVLHAKVKPEYINWVSTLHKNSYQLKEEREIQVIEGKEVLLYDVTTYNRKFNQGKNSRSLNINTMIKKY